nr:unnamed protein product [Callosobruchus analis]
MHKQKLKSSRMCF